MSKRRGMAGLCLGRLSEGGNEAAIGKFEEEIAKEKDEGQSMLNLPPTFHLSYSLHTSHFPSFLSFPFLTERGGDPAPDPDLGTERDHLAPQAPPTTTTSGGRRGPKGTGKEARACRAGAGTEAGGNDEGIG